MTINNELCPVPINITGDFSSRTESIVNALGVIALAVLSLLPIGNLTKAALSKKSISI